MALVAGREGDIARLERSHGSQAALARAKVQPGVLLATHTLVAKPTLVVPAGRGLDQPFTSVAVHRFDAGITATSRANSPASARTARIRRTMVGVVEFRI